MDERTRRMIMWVVILSLIAIIAVFAIARKMELDRMADRIASGTPTQQMEATQRLIQKQKLLEGLEERPRWVQERAILAVSRLATHEAIWEASATVGVLDDPPQARLREAIRKQGEVVLDLLIEAIQDKDANRRGCCATPLGQVGEPAIDPLSRLMDAWDQYVRDIVRDQLHTILAARSSAISSAESLVETRKKRLELAKQRLGRPRDPNNPDAPDPAQIVAEEPAKIAEAEAALAKVPKDLIIDDLVMDILKSDPPSADQKEEAAKYLRRVATAKAIVTAKSRQLLTPAIVEQLLTHEKADVRATGCELLGTYGDQTYTLTGDVVGAPLAEEEAQKMVAPLLERLQTDPEWTVRRKAAIALGRLQLAAMKGKATKPLIAALDDPRPDVKAAAAQALGMIAAARPFDTTALKWVEGLPNETALAAAQPLALTLRKNRAGAASELAVALEKVGPPAIPHLIPALSHSDDEVRLLATQTIASIGTEAAVVPLAQYSLFDPVVAVRQTAADALRELATPAVIPHLIRALNDSDWKVYYAAKDALARLGATAVPQLVKALSSDNARVAYTAEQALAAIRGPAVEPLIVSLSSRDPQVLRWVSIALGEIGYDAVAPAARVLRTNANPSTRAAAARALGHTGYADAVKPLLEAANDPVSEVRIAVASALVKLGDPRATPTLIKLLQDRDLAVRSATMERLTEWYDPPTVPALAKLLDAKDEDVKRRAAILLGHHVGGQEELRAAVASATTAGEAHDVAQAVMNDIADATDDLIANKNLAKAQRLLEEYAKATDPGPRYAAVAAIATVARRTSNDQVRQWAIGILEDALAIDIDDLREQAERARVEAQLAADQKAANAVDMEQKATDAETKLGAAIELQQTAAVAVAHVKVPAVLEGAINDPTVAGDVRRHAIEGLALLGTNTSVEPLIKICRAGGEDGRRAAQAIGSIGRRLSEESEGKSPEAAQAAKELITLAIKEQDPYLRAELGLSVAMIGEAAVKPAIEFLRTAEESQKPFAAAILGKLGNVAVDPYLLRARNELRGQSGQESLREWFAVALWTTGDKMARDYCEALPDEEEPAPEKIALAAQELDKLLDIM
ncbi:MAG: HEAT repeat domain-containing protein [Candidatus Zipacnadales bacterium]